MKIFITGVTGYIGGSIASRLVEGGHTVIGLVRDIDKAQILANMGVVPLVGGLDDEALLYSAARDADCVINAASSDHRGAVEAIIAGLSGSGKRFLHTSGSSVIADDAQGDRCSDLIFDEDTPFIVPEEKRCRLAIDQLVCAAVDRGIRATVLCNSMIYGQGLGLQCESSQIPLLAREARKLGAVHVIGRGLNCWSNVHIEDVVDLYLGAIETAAPSGFYFVENGEASLIEIGVAIADRLAIPLSEDWNIEDASDHLGFSRAHYSLASNSRVNSSRARRELHWRPCHASVLDWIRNEMPVSARARAS
ncbi:MAG: 2-alkyl-3-oxoalkanoate reductase [Burkholderia lata]|uniref:2-alkyl-3-oxoalkanoate reductase n=1 Tax=Burkholderia lata (strain ATCC 17760 / DSM 23089 / LMG 22485 / NCIMB 9086 / R18194 / 383) TaxID=482957 RepID=A0A833PJQ3_BURL3|nr:NAD-dependent epimerase/dehydratase family protein [Burkholderia lata]KAF1033986.1 MAG: 2-alkyl-3-oxoalkanoate reductase [Burkholderia lata]